MLAEMGIGTATGSIQLPAPFAFLPQGDFRLVPFPLKILHPGGKKPPSILQRAPGKVHDPTLARQLPSILKDKPVKAFLPHQPDSLLPQRPRVAAALPGQTSLQ